jgi:hypothetical protein
MSSRPGARTRKRPFFPKETGPEKNGETAPGLKAGASAGGVVCGKDRAKNQRPQPAFSIFSGPGRIALRGIEFPFRLLPRVFRKSEPREPESREPEQTDRAPASSCPYSPPDMLRTDGGDVVLR